LGEFPLTKSRRRKLIPRKSREPNQQGGDKTQGNSRMNAKEKQRGTGKKKKYSGEVQVPGIGKEKGGTGRGRGKLNMKRAQNKWAGSVWVDERRGNDAAKAEFDHSRSWWQGAPHGTKR